MKAIILTWIPFYFEPNRLESFWRIQRNHSACPKTAKVRKKASKGAKRRIHGGKRRTHGAKFNKKIETKEI